jgi:hypothetical protein
MSLSDLITLGALLVGCVVFWALAAIAAAKLM